MKMYWTPAKMLLLADVGEYSFANADMVTWICTNIGSGNGLLPDGTKPLPEPLLTYRQ